MRERHLSQIAAADQRRAQPGQVTLARCGKTPIERLRHDQPQHCVADELQLLVVGAGLGVRSGLLS